MAYIVIIAGILFSAALAGSFAVECYNVRPEDMHGLMQALEGGVDNAR
jgi:hypothetical protein